MNPTDDTEFTKVLDQVRTWPTPLQVALARRILDTVNVSPSPSNSSKPPKTMSLDQVIGLLKTSDRPPTDEECRQIVEEERAYKYS